MFQGFTILKKPQEQSFYGEQILTPGTAQGVRLEGPPFWLIKSLFFYFSKPGLSFTKKYITLFNVKYADLLGYAALF